MEKCMWDNRFFEPKHKKQNKIVLIPITIKTFI